MHTSSYSDVLSIYHVQSISKVYLTCMIALRKQDNIFKTCSILLVMFPNTWQMLVPSSFILFSFTLLFHLTTVYCVPSLWLVLS